MAPACRGSATLATRLLRTAITPSETYLPEEHTMQEIYDTLWGSGKAMDT